MTVSECIKWWRGVEFFIKPNLETSCVVGCAFISFLQKKLSYLQSKNVNSHLILKSFNYSLVKSYQNCQIN